MAEQTFDFSTKTDHEIHIIVREALDKIGLRQRLYPGFIRKTNSCETREDLLLVVKTTLEKAKKLTKEHVTQKVMPSKNAKSSSGVYTHTSGPYSSTLYQKGNTDLKSEGVCLSLWEKIHRHDLKLEDPEQVARLAYYSKYQNIIKQVIDPFQVLTVSDAVVKANLNKIRVSRKVLDRLLNDLYTDDLIKLEVIPCGLRSPAYVFSTERCSKERYERYTKRLRESNGIAEKVTSPNRSHDKKGNAAERVVNHNEEVKRLTVEKELGLMKGSEERVAESKSKKPKPKEEKVPEPTAEQLARSKIAEESRKKIKKPISHDKVINIKYTCQSCRIKRYQDKELEKHPCPECKNEMAPILDGDVKADGAVTYLKEFDKR